MNLIETLIRAVRAGDIVAVELATQLIGQFKLVDLTPEQASAWAELLKRSGSFAN
jgi:hypothetical protein